MAAHLKTIAVLMLLQEVLGSPRNPDQCDTDIGGDHKCKIDNDSAQIDIEQKLSVDDPSIRLLQRKAKKKSLQASCDMDQCKTIPDGYQGEGNEVCCPMGKTLYGDGSACRACDGSACRDHCATYGNIGSLPRCSTVTGTGISLCHWQVKPELKNKECNVTDEGRNMDNFRDFFIGDSSTSLSQCMSECNSEPECRFITYYESETNIPTIAEANFSIMRVVRTTKRCRLSEACESPQYAWYKPTTIYQKV